MKNLPVLYFGIMLMITAAWSGLILASNIQLGGLQPSAMDDGSPYYPVNMPGLARQGEQVYIEMGCVNCHSQQARSASASVLMAQPIKDKNGKSLEGMSQFVFVSPDIARGWAVRGSVARDYIFEDRALLGDMRIGPDLVDIGGRIAKTIDNTLLLHLYDPRITTPGSIMPPFAFLFTTQKIHGEVSGNALRFVNDSPGARPPEGYEVIPSARATALVAYLRSLNTEYDLLELHNVAAP